MADSLGFIDIDRALLRQAFGCFATGVTVLTTRQGDGTPRGFTANSFTSVSLDPPLLLVCVAKSAHSCSAFMESGHFAVNVLGENQKAVSGLFASREPDKFDRAAWFPGSHGVPLIAGSLAHFACARETLVDAGDHVVLIGRVLDFALADGGPLGYFRGNYFSIGMEAPLVRAAADGSGTRIGAVLSSEGHLLLEEQPDGNFCLPLAPGRVPRLDELREQLRARGLTAHFEFLYAVYEDRETATHNIYYHGHFTGSVPKGMRLWPFDEVPWDRIANSAERSMLRRYTDELRHGIFSIYQGNETEGVVRRIANS